MSDLLHSYQLELKKQGLALTGVSSYATVLAKVIGHQLSIRDQHHSDLQQDILKLTRRIGELESKLFKMQTKGDGA